MSDSEFYERVRRVFANKEIEHDQEFGRSNPRWNLSIDPQTGIVMISFRPNLLLEPREIHAMISTLEMRLQSLSREARSAP